MTSYPPRELTHANAHTLGDAAQCANRLQRGAIGKRRSASALSASHIVGRDPGLKITARRGRPVAMLCISTLRTRGGRIALTRKMQAICNSFEGRSPRSGRTEHGPRLAEWAFVVSELWSAASAWIAAKPTRNMWMNKPGRSRILHLRDARWACRSKAAFRDSRLRIGLQNAGDVPI